MINQAISVAYTCAALLLCASNSLAATPAVNSDIYNATEDTIFSVSAPGVLGNDIADENDSLSATLASPPANGVLTFSSNGSFSYIPNAQFHGTDSFTYRAVGLTGTSAPVLVTIAVQPVNDRPSAASNTFNTFVNTPLFESAPGVLGNDSDADGDPLTAVLVSNPSQGAVALEPTGAFAFTPPPGFSGNASFSYVATDGLMTSAVATVTISVIPEPVAVVSSPQSQTVCPGGTANFRISVTSTVLSYQWYKSSTALPGKTNSVLTISNITTSDAGTYRVRVAGPANSVTNSASLTIGTQTAVASLPRLLRSIGSAATFNAAVTGSGPFTYTWLHNGTVLGGQTGSRLVLTNLSIEQGGAYTVIVAGPCNTVTNSGSLEVAPCFNEFDVMLVIDRSGSMSGKPYVDARSAATNFARNLRLGPTNDQIGLVSFNPSSTLNQTLTTNRTTMEQKINNLGPATNGTCISCGLVTAQTELESARHRPEALPVIVLLSDGLPHDFDTESNALYNATWIKNAGTRIFTVGLGSGVDPVLMAAMASSPSDYFFANDSSELSGLFDAISTVICRPPTNIFGPSDLTLCSGERAEFTVGASGCASFTYQWQKDGLPIGGATSNVFSIATTGPADAGIYSCVVVGSCRTVTNHARLIINEPASVPVPPGNQSAYIGSNAVLSVAANGTGLSYQWYFQGSLLGTNSDLYLEAVTRQLAGAYTVIVNGSACGGPVTNVVQLAVLNRPPGGRDDAYMTMEDMPLQVAAPGVLGNDIEPDGDAINAELVAGPNHGTVLLDANGAFTYTPAANFNGYDSFTYRATDGQLASPEITVVLWVPADNDRPIATNDSYTTPEDTVLSVPFHAGVLLNDFDVDEDALVALVVDEPQHGTVHLYPDGAFDYIPSTNFHGVDFFTYYVSDGFTVSEPATASITVLPRNDSPLALNDVLNAVEDLPLIVPAPGVLANDIDLDGDSLTATLVSAPARGAIQLQSDGSFIYHPATNFHGVDTFEYRAIDASGDSHAATVTINVLPANDPPVSRDDGREGYTVLEDQSLAVNGPGVLANDIDEDGDPLNCLLVTGPAYGSLTLNVDGSFLYSPGPDFNGTDTFTYVTADQQTSSGPATVTIVVRPVNDRPAFAAGTAQRVNYNAGPQSVAEWARSIHAGPDNEAHQSTQFTVWTDDPSLFSVSPAVSPNGTLTYTPSETIGTATVWLRIQDDGGTDEGGTDSSDAVSFTITLNGPPLVAFISPTNNTTLVGTNNFSALVEAFDPDGVITNVDVFHGTNLVISLVGQPYLTLLNDVPFGTNLLYAVATDDLGLTATSAVVSIILTQSPPVQAVGPVVFNMGTGLFEQYARVYNPGPWAYPDGVRVFITELPPTNIVYNASGSRNGIPFIDLPQPLAANAFADVLIKYYLPSSRVAPNPTLVVEPLSQQAIVPSAPMLRISRDERGNLQVGFVTVSNRLYYLQSSIDSVRWTNASGIIRGTGGRVDVHARPETGLQIYRALVVP